MKKQNYKIKPREGWHEAFQEMARNSDDILLIPEIFNLESDKKDWQWEEE